MGKMSRNKGARGEREVAELLKGIFPEARRRCSGAESQCDQGRDLDGTGGLCVQVNLSARPPIERKVFEAVAAAKPDEIPVAITRKSSRFDSGRWMASMPLEAFLALLCEAGYPHQTMPFASPNATKVD